MNLEARKRMTAERFEHLRLLYNDRGYLVINECLDEIARLRSAIETAPHGANCEGWIQRRQYPGRKCTCWVRDALENDTPLDAIEAAMKEKS